MARSSRFKLTMLALVAVVATAVPAAASRASDTGTLQFHLVIFKNTWHQVSCPAGTPSSGALCEAMTGQGIVAGLGRTTESYTYVLDDLNVASTTVHFVAALVVAGKGEIDVSAATPAPVCPCGGDDATLDFTVTGGTGTFAGAQGSGTVVSAQRATGPSSGFGIDTWSGTLTVAGYTFDIARPVISGAASMTVKAPRGARHVRVAYKITALDPDEGRLVVTCAPRSGSYFTVGRTHVVCGAMDANGNSAHAGFTVTVKHA